MSKTLFFFEVISVGRGVTNAHNNAKTVGKFAWEGGQRIGGTSPFLNFSKYKIES